MTELEKRLNCLETTIDSNHKLTPFDVASTIPNLTKSIDQVEYLCSTGNFNGL